MKKIITSLFLLGLVFGMQAQTQILSDFEDGGVNHIRVGDYNTDGNPGWYDSSLYVDGGQPQIGSNPSKSGINTSDKCVFAVNVADADWWGNFFTLYLDQPITITESNKYLHMQIYRSIQPKDLRISFNHRDGENEGAGQRIWQGSLSADATWEDVVIDLTSKIGQDFQFLGFICSTNWSDPRSGWGVATYAFDNIALSSSPIPPDITLLDGNGLSVGFEDQGEYDKWVKSVDLQNENNTAEVIDNPFTDNSVNNTGKIFQFDKSDQASWWQGPLFDFNGIMAVGDPDPSYIHVMVYVPAVVLGDLYSIDIQLCAKDHMKNENTQLFTVWDDEVDQWIDLVMPVDKIAYLSELTVRFDVRRNADDTDYDNSPANTFYLDAITFDKNPDPRTKVETGLPEISTGTPLSADIRTLKGAIQVNLTQPATIQVYNVLGGLVKSKSANGSATIDLGNGIYIVKVTSATGEEQITKVIVQ